MCFHGTLRNVYVNNLRKEVGVDACIAAEVHDLNEAGVVTLGCCCGHGKAGQNVEWANGYGTWKAKSDPPIALISEESVGILRKMGYTPFPYYYADDVSDGVWQMPLKTGCITEQDCEEWHEKYGEEAVR